MNSDKTLFDTFNARNLTFEQVAATFISNKQFEDLIDNNHTLLMGPRGSGKTTLLKMLTPMALNKWEGKGVNEIKKRIPFNGVYIPTDSQFKRQLEYLRLRLPENEYNTFSRAIVTTNILVALIKTFYFLVKDESIGKEAAVSKVLINAWKLPKPMAPTFHSIEQVLLLRVSEINNFINRILSAPNQEGGILFPSYFYDDFLPLCEIACTSFELEYPKYIHSKWALCFDELELAPEWLQTNLLEMLRSTIQKFLFKLTTSPVISSSDILSGGINKFEASYYNDYKIVRTWPVNNTEVKRWDKFCDKLISNKIERRFNSAVLPTDLLGSDSLERTGRGKNSEQSDEYGRNSLTWNLIKEYSETDESLKRFLVGKGVDPRDPIPNTPSQRDTLFRKIKQILIFRYSYTYLVSNKGRSRKNVPLFYGVPYIYEICDGNPRQLIGLIDELFSRVTKNEKGMLNALAINVQSEVIANTSSRYLKLLATHPEATVSIGNRSTNAADLLLRIGSYFHERLVHEPFTIDPVGSFIVDTEDRYIVSLVEFALTYGALVYVNPNEGVSNQGVIGKRFRLSYLLSPAFKIPKRDYSAVNLSSILSYRLKQSEGQLKLFY